MRLILTIFSLVLCLFSYAQHPITFFKASDISFIKKELNKYPLLTRSFNDIKQDVDSWVNKDVDVPLPKDPAGGYTHEKHKSNYMLMFNSGILYNLTGEAKYATLVKNILLKYADLNPQLKKHPQATSSSPGHIFWQALNDANWLVYTGMAYDLVYNEISAADRKTIETGAFKPEVDFFTKDLESWFNLIHNHGVWACAGVGITGLATNNKEYVDMALYGTKKDGKSGFIAQMDGLFSPDGYYTEGPYYVRYAILPYYLFANALQHAKPELKIFEHRNQILKKALLAGLQQTNLDGRFFAMNDAIKEKDYTSNELVSAVDIAWEMYGADDNFLTVAKKQDRVLINKGGASIAAAIASRKNIPPYLAYKSIEYSDGAKGDEGGISIMRCGKSNDQTTLLFKYTSHGLSHGHYDKLNINLFDKGNEILQDYGAVRFIGVEQKYGGRYLPESKSYAEQTIAHNTVTVDEKSHYNGDEKTAEKFHAEKIFSDISNPAVQVVSAKDEHAYKDVTMQRTVYLIQLPVGNKLMVDIFNIKSDDTHQYDLPFQYSGQLINTSFKYDAFTKKQDALGKKSGYQFLWKEAEANVGNSTSQFTFLNGQTYYTISSLIEDTAQLYFTRVGANDPNFNLRHEPAFIIRKFGRNQSFINVVEIHGKYDARQEFSADSYPSVQKINLVENNKDYSVAEITVAGKKLVIAQCNSRFDKNEKHSINKNNINAAWTGPFTVLYDGKKL